jgi:molybdopterin converting factor small subunit
MLVRFTLPGAWRTLTGTDLSDVTCEAATVGEALTWLSDTYPVLRQRLFTDTAELAPWTLVCLDHADVRTIGNLDAPVTDGGELQIIPALMGG